MATGSYMTPIYSRSQSHIVESGTIKPSPTKTLAVRKFPETTTIKQVQSFLGSTGYFRKYIKDYSKIAKPLSDLTRKENLFVFFFGTEQKEAFEKLKKIMSEGPILHLYKRLQKKDLITRIDRCALQLEEFDYEIEHRTGSRMKHVDALSRYPVMMVCNNTLTSKLKKAQEEDNNIQTFKSLLTLKQESEEFFERNGILYKYLNGRELIVTPKAMQAELIKLIHENGHFSVGKTEEIVKQEFFIPNLSNVVKKTHLPNIYLAIYPVKTVPVESALEKLKQQQKTFGNPIRIISDRGSAFTSKLFNDYCDEENIQHLQIATGVPRGNGQVERIHRTLIPVLTKLSLDDSTKWYKYVDRLQRILNSTISRSTKWTPFELLVGIKMRNKEDILIKDLILEEMAKELLEQREFLRNDAKKNIETLLSENRKTYNRRRKKASLYKEGDLVAIQRTQFGAGLKLRPKFLSPYKK
ncbi:transposon Tf2-9 polyprotein [Trichonephila clavipes]|nr:transposon Tf2-9 polyprotein [Trichonephila clavipes]